MQSRRNERLTSRLPASFRLNWDHCENGKAHPVESEGCTTYLGPPITDRAGRGDDFIGNRMVIAAELIRACGWDVNIIPQNFLEEGEDDDDDDDDVLIERERELAYFHSGRYRFDPVKVFDANRRLIISFRTIGLDDPWLCLTCMDSQVSNLIYHALQHDFDVAVFSHRREDVQVVTHDIDSGGSYRLEALTGDQLESETKDRITTLFSLYFRDEEGPEEKLVAKALCSYQNMEIDRVGPTLELIETAREWRQHGLGDALMYAIEVFYLERFEHFRARIPIWFSICHVISYEAGQWFEKFGFEDLDGMGDDMRKILNAYEFDHSDESADDMDY